MHVFLYVCVCICLTLSASQIHFMFFVFSSLKTQHFCWWQSGRAATHIHTLAVMGTAGVKMNERNRWRCEKGCVTWMGKMWSKSHSYYSVVTKSECNQFLTSRAANNCSRNNKFNSPSVSVAQSNVLMPNTMSAVHNAADRSDFTLYSISVT